MLLFTIFFSIRLRKVPTSSSSSSWARFLHRSCPNSHSYTEPSRFSGLSWYSGDPRQPSSCLRQVRRCMICEADLDELSHGLASIEPACCMVVVQREHNGQRTSSVCLWLLRSGEEGLDITPRWSYAVGSQRSGLFVAVLCVRRPTFGFAPSLASRFLIRT